MKISIISIGDELLSGFTINTNASWIGSTLTSIGCSICNQITVEDNKKSIIEGLENLSKKSVDLILLTGGLGSTNDDITRETLFSFLSSNPIFDQLYWEKLKKKVSKSGYKIPVSMKNQAIVPDNGKIIPNSTGSARGFHFKYKNIKIISLPGVPSEMKEMMSKTVIPFILDRISIPKITKELRTFGISESRISNKINLITREYKNCKVGYYPSLKGVDIRVSGYIQDDVTTLVSKIIKKINVYIYSRGKKTMEEVIVDLLNQKGKSFSIAESCTGGLISSRITNVSGSSKVFNGSVVSYSNRSKVELLNIDKNIINKYGAVSRQVANLMALNTLKLFSSDYAISVTGIAGPLGGSKLKPVGLVYVGFSNNLKTKVKKFQFGTDRIANKIKISQVSLNIIREALIND